MDEALLAGALEEGLDVRPRTQRIVLPERRSVWPGRWPSARIASIPGERRLHEAEPAVAAGVSRQPATPSTSRSRETISS